MTRRWPVALFYSMIDVSAINAYVVWQRLHDENNRIFSKKRRKFLNRLEKELAEMSSALSMQKRRAIHLQSNRKRTAATDNPAKNAKKARCSLCERSKDRKCRQACSACNNNICQKHSQVICIQCNH